MAKSKTSSKSASRDLYKAQNRRTTHKIRNVISQNLPKEDIELMTDKELDKMAREYIESSKLNGKRGVEVRQQMRSEANKKKLKKNDKNPD